MAHARSGIAGQIIGSFEDIGKDIARETAKAPTEIIGRALEGGTAKGQKGQQTAAAQAKPKTENTPLDQISQTKEQRTKQAMARAGLQYLAAKPASREQGVYEKQQKEQEEKKQFEKLQKEEAAKKELKPMATKARRGNLFGTTKKKAGSETSRNVRGD